jgi:hypothetical protein
MFELIFYILGEFLLQVMAETLASIGFGAMGETFRKQPNPWLAAIGYGLLGAMVGGVSLLVFRTPLISLGAWRLFNLVVTPIAVGMVIAALGAWKIKRGKMVFRIDRFSYGYLFALSFAWVRYHYLTGLPIH